MRSPIPIPLFIGVFTLTFWKSPVWIKERASGFPIWKALKLNEYAHVSDVGGVVTDVARQPVVGAVGLGIEVCLLALASQLAVGFLVAGHAQ